MSRPDDGTMPRSVGEAARVAAKIAGNVSTLASAAVSSSEVLGQVAHAVHELAELSNGLRTRVGHFAY